MLDEHTNTGQHAQRSHTRPRVCACAVRGEGGSLDNSTNIVTPPTPKRQKVDLETGEIHQDFDPTLKWQMKQVSMLALGVFNTSVPYEQRHRIRICYRHVIGEGSLYQREVDIRTKEGARPYYTGLMTCGSVWVCPVCAAKIQAVRSSELRQAIDTWLESGGSVYMATYTIPHTRQDVLESLLGNFLQAHRKLAMGAPWKRLLEQFQIAGQVKALEVTWGTANGWHPHAHVLYFSKQPTLNMSQLADQLFQRWVSACGRVGITGLSRDAFTLQDASKAHAYVTKLGKEYTWGPEDELVRSHSKTGKGSSFTPFDFLRSYLVQPDDGQRLALFAEFGNVFKGRQQLVWSRGFKKRLLGSEGLSDEAVAASIGELDPILATITFEQWQYIRRYNMQGTVLHVAEMHGADGVAHLLRDSRGGVTQ